MTTEQCSVDSLPKSRAETFARQLQNRLRTLSNENERDGPEDLSWNGDQLSSSSDDIYYDLDSYPGSPAEEATESNFTNYINVKPTENLHPTELTNRFLNCNECSVGSEIENKIDCEQLSQCSITDPINCFKNINGEQCIYLNNSERSHYGHSKSENSDNITLLSSNESLNCHLHHNGSPKSLFPLGKCLYSNWNTNEPESDFNGFNCNNTTQTIRSEVLNGFESRFQNCNGSSSNTTKNYILNGNETEDIHENQSLSNLPEPYCCYSTQNKSKPIDVNSNSSVSNHNVGDQNKVNNSENNENKMTLESNVFRSNKNSTRDDPDLSRDFEDKCKICTDNEIVCEEVTVKKVETFTEEDLNRLVDAVFLNLQENFCDNSNEKITEDTNNAEKSNKQNCTEEEESIESKRSKFRRSSSLKTGKTPPGTPGCKKIVRFADVLGLDLADVRTFLDEVPKVPKSAFTDLKNVELPSSPPVNMLDSFMGQIAKEPSGNSRVQRTIVPLFQQPSSRLEFLDRIRNNAVCLENAVITDPALFVITGIVRVKNIDFHKSVHIRYSIDNWKSFADLQAKYIPNSCDGFSDKFTFILYAHMLTVGQRLEFAVRYHTNGSVFWDNNLGANYTFQCVPDGPSKVLPSGSYVTPNPIETWASFY